MAELARKDDVFFLSTCCFSHHCLSNSARLRFLLNSLNSVFSHRICTRLGFFLLITDAYMCFLFLLLRESANYPPVVNKEAALRCDQRGPDVCCVRVQVVIAVFTLKLLRNEYISGLCSCFSTRRQTCCRRKSCWRSTLYIATSRLFSIFVNSKLDEMSNLHRFLAAIARGLICEWFRQQTDSQKCWGRTGSRLSSRIKPKHAR